MTDEIRIDEHFARFGAKSYAINKINSVEVRSERAHSDTAMVIWGLVAIIALALFATDPAIVSAIIAAGAGFMAYRAWHKTKVMRHFLILMTSSSEVQAFTSLNETEVVQLRDAIERAIIGKADGQTGQ